MADVVLSGSLSAFRLPEVLTFLSTTRKAGTLTVGSDGREASLFFNDGNLVFASSNQERFRLGSILLRKRKITQDQSNRIDSLMQRGGRFGQLAVQEGVLTDTQLRDFLKVQVSEIVYDCFAWTSGVFAFASDLALPAHAVTISIDLGNLIMEGARRIEEWEQCLRLLPDRSTVFRVVVTPKDEKITLTADEWRILFLINGLRTLEELCHDAEDEPFDVYRVVYGLYANRLIETAPAPAAEYDDTNVKRAAEEGDATFKQHSPEFGRESTVRDEDIEQDDTSLLVSSEAHLSYTDVVRPTIAQLTFANGDAQGRVVPLSESEYLVGRHQDNSITIPDLGVSGFHARIYRGPDGYVIEDLKSRNGTWLNGERVYHATLTTGDRIHLGQTDLMFEVLF